jgi:diguanylate cyclase (GGDEF)-like protein/PAS domain S-box-containing protein
VNEQPAAPVSPPVPDGPGRLPLELLYDLVDALELSPAVAVHSTDSDGVVRFWNRACTALFGVPASEAVGQRFDSLVSHLDGQAEFDAAIASIWATGQAVAPRDWYIARRDGQRRWVYSTHFPVLRDGHIKHVFCMDVDISERKYKEEALQAAGVNFNKLYERSTDAIVLIERGRIVDANPAALLLFGCGARTAMLGHTLRDFSPPAQPPDGAAAALAAAIMDADAAVAAAAAAADAAAAAAADAADAAVAPAPGSPSEPLAAPGNLRYEWQFALPDGSTFWAEVLRTSISFDHVSLSYAMIRDISARKAAERNLLTAAQVFENSRDAIVIMDRGGRVVAVNEAFSRIFGYARADVLGRDPPGLREGVHDVSYYRQIWDFVDAHEHWEGEVWSRRKNGEEFPVWAALTAIRDGDGGVSNYMAIVTDITDRKRAEEHTRHLAEHDFLTDLPNRVLFVDRLQQALAAARRHHSAVALMFVDLDRFKLINDSHGHQLGDAVLKEVAARLARCVRGVDTVSRQGGDEFVIILADVGGADQAAHVAGSVMAAVAQPLHAGGVVLALSVSIGIALYPGDGEDGDTLLARADVAMYHAKQDGRNAFRFFSPHMNAQVVERVQMETRLQAALAREEFVLAYQPEIDIESGRTIGVEALIRWRHPERGLLLPHQFISTAEQCGLMVPIGEWVLQEACAQARRWRDQGFPVVVAVNLSSVQFIHANLVASVDAALAHSGLAPQFLDLEITEGVVMNGDASTLATIKALRTRGVQLTVDDFGTGFSNLGRLQGLPLSKLKIDRSFVSAIDGVGADGEGIVPAIIGMARSLRLRVIAEGVETAEQLRYLQRHGCDQYQGYYASMASEHPDLGAP